MTWFLLAMTSAIFSASAAITQKKVLFKASALDFTTALSIINLIVILPLLFFYKFPPIEGTTMLVIIFKTVMSGIAFLCVMNGIKRMEISSSLPLLVLTPGIVAAAAYLLLGESLTASDLVGMVMLLVGTYVLQVGTKADLLSPWKALRSSKGIIFIFGALLIFSTTSILDKVILKSYKVPPLAFWGLQHIILCMFFVFVTAVVKREFSGVRNAFKESGKLIILISLFTVIYRYAFILAVKMAPVALVLSMKRTSVLFATIFGGKYFKEHSIGIKAIATGLMILGAVGIVYF